MKLLTRINWTCIIGLILVVSPIGVHSSEITLIDGENQSQQDRLMQQVERAIATSKRRYLSTETHSPWQIMHGMLSMRYDYQIKQNGVKVSALEWVASNPSFRGEPLLQLTPYGARFHPFNYPYAFEGHPCQFLSFLTMYDLPLDYEFRVEGKTVTLADIINNAKMEVNDREEVTWVLWSLCHWVHPDEQWVNKYGEPWSLERIVRTEIGKNTEKAACGGTHGLFALSYACQKYEEKTGRRISGAWREADYKVNRYIQTARHLQNRDGSFSSESFRGRGYTSDINKRLATTGHILEFLMMALPDNQLNQQWVRNAVYAVSRDLVNSQQTTIKCGPLYHSVHSLVLYQERIAKRYQQEKSAEEQMAQDRPKIQLPEISQQPRRYRYDLPAPATPAQEVKISERIAEEAAQDDDDRRSRRASRLSRLLNTRHHFRRTR